MTDDNLDDLFAPAPAKPSLDMRYRQGRIVTFNPTTLENTVDVGGTVLTNLPILGVGEATLLAAGSNVGIAAIQSDKGAATWAILGRMVTPNTADAFNAISLLSSSITTAAVETQETTSTNSYVDLTTPGPSVTVNIRQTGRILLVLTCQIQWIDADPADGRGGEVTVEMSGANTMTTATAEGPIRLTNFNGSNAGTSMTLQGTYTQAVVVSGLNPGSTTITMKYKARPSGEASGVDFGRRAITVFAL